MSKIRSSLHLVNQSFGFQTATVSTAGNAMKIMNHTIHLCKRTLERQLKILGVLRNLPYKSQELIEDNNIMINIPMHVQFSFLNVDCVWIVWHSKKTGWGGLRVWPWLCLWVRRTCSSCNDLHCVHQKESKWGWTSSIRSMLISENIIDVHPLHVN